jgi:urease accessory protein
MTATARLLEQRSIGHVHLRMERNGIAVMREAGSAKCRMPRGTHEAILINTSGGLAGGDCVSIKAEVGAGAALTLTTQAAERVYRTLGPAAEMRVSVSVATGACLCWVPQETIFFEGSSLCRKLDVDLAEGAEFLSVEPMVFGRREMGERVSRVSVLDRWTIRRSGKLMHAEIFKLGPHWPQSKARFANNHACATLLLVSQRAETLIDSVRLNLGPDDGASAWNGKLVVRLLAPDGFHLRKKLVQLFTSCLGRDRLPKTWSF